MEREDNKMAYNGYISALQSLRRTLDNKIDNEIEDVIRGRGNSSELKLSLNYIIQDDQALSGRYKDDECM